jgi:DNA-directed RNA polymerase subunit omega
MSIVNPNIDELLEKSDHDRFLLCSMASKRARDINDMMRGQRDRAVALQSVDEIAKLARRKPLSLAMEEIARGEVSYDKPYFEEEATEEATGQE